MVPYHHEKVTLKKIINSWRCLILREVSQVIHQVAEFQYSKAEGQELHTVTSGTLLKASPEASPDTQGRGEILLFIGLITIFNLFHLV